MRFREKHIGLLSVDSIQVSTSFCSATMRQRSPLVPAPAPASEATSVCEALPEAASSSAAPVTSSSSAASSSSDRPAGDEPSGKRQRTSGEQNALCARVTLRRSRVTSSHKACVASPRALGRSPHLCPRACQTFLLTTDPPASAAETPGLAEELYQLAVSILPASTANPTAEGVVSTPKTLTQGVLAVVYTAFECALQAAVAAPPLLHCPGRRSTPSWPWAGRVFGRAAGWRAGRSLGPSHVH